MPVRMDDVRAGRVDFADLFWLNLQAHYDLEVATARLGPRLDREVRPRAA